MIELVLDYGASQRARDGAVRHALDKAAMRRIRRDWGREIAKAVGAYRDVYVIRVGDRILTVARSARPTFH